MVNSTTEKAQNLSIAVDTNKWFEHLRTDKYGLYGNCADLVETHVLPVLEAGDPTVIAATVLSLDEQWRKVNKIIIFELAMYTWAGFKDGKYSAEAWAAVLAIAWQSGSRGMLATVKLSQAEVIELFKAAPMHVIHKIVSNGRIDVQAEYDALPDAIEVIRGVSTGINNFEDGFSWTRINGEAVRFAALNCQTKKDVPGFVRATIPKNAVLAMFSFEGEVVVDPTIKKLKVQTHFLRGPELRKFHANIDVEANTLDILFKTDNHSKRMNARPTRSAKNDWELPVFLRTEPQAQLAD